MSRDERTSTTIEPDSANGGGTVVQFPRTREGKAPKKRFWRRRRKPKRFRVRKLRVLVVLFGLGVLAVVSALFGMFMALASDLPPIDPLEKPATPSVIVDARGKVIGTLTGNERRIYLSEGQIAPVMKQAIIAIEDRRFYTNDGIDLRGIARAAVQDLTAGEAVQGASTIPQQFVKLSLAAENERTIFQKLREAAMAYHLNRRWSKEQILRNYLNEIYFGNGAYGIESAARTYFSYNHDNCGGRDGDKLEPPCASMLLPHEAALLAAMVASPSAYDPVQHPVAAKKRRDLVLLRMYEQGYITRSLYQQGKREPIPTRDDLTFPREDTDEPYFTSWIKQQVVDQLGGGQQGAKLAFEGGLQVETTIDSRLQDAAEKAIHHWLGKSGGPRASLVAISNKDGAVRAMYGGDDYNARPFNLATQGQRQPGSSFKPFVYAVALERGVTPATVMQDTALQIQMAGSSVYRPKNSDDLFRGPVTVRQALTQSINTVAIQLGMEVGFGQVVEAARRFGFSTPVRPYPSSTLGAAVVRPVELAAAYTAFANRGMRVEPFLVRRVADASGKTLFDARGKGTRVLSPGVAFLVTDMLRDAAEKGTGTEARQRLPSRIPMAGKTGTTDDGTDVWYVGFTPEVVTAVWVGFDTPKTLGAGAYGGAVAAPIWGDMMRDLYARRRTPEPWTVPSGVLRVATDGTTGLPLTAPCPTGPVRTEYFAAGTEPSGACVLQDGILVPAGDTLPADSILLGDVPPDTLAADTLAIDSLGMVYRPGRP